MAKSLAEQAYEQIRRKIVTLQLAPGSIINEAALGEELGLGRTPIREALRFLAAENLIVIMPRRGVFVSEISVNDLPQLVELRLALEGFCARLAAGRASQEQIDQMIDELRKLEKVADEDDATLMEIDQHLHEILYEAAGNKFLADVLENLYSLALRLWYLVLPRISGMKEDVSLFSQLVAHLQVRDADAAEQVMRRHVSSFQQRVKAAL